MKLHPETEKNLRAYRIFKPIYLKAHPYCEMFANCLRRATQIHHMNRRGHHYRHICYEPWLKATCNQCHQFVENHKKEARQMGLILYK
jgi:hypothetical protein